MTAPHRALAAVAGAALVMLPACAPLQPGAGPAPSPDVSVQPAATPTPSPAPEPSPSPPAATFASTYQDVSPGVVRIDAARCAEAGSGTGFLIAPDLVATVAHVVSGAATVRLTQGTRSVAATVLGLDEATDTALLRTSRPLAGHVFEFAAKGPVVGERIGVIGFPAGDSGLLTSRAGSKSFKEGSINGLGRKAEIEGRMRTDLVELDALARSGNSGSPVIEVDGEVVGLLSAAPFNNDAARSRFAVSSLVAKPLLDTWRASAEPVAPQDCAGAVGPDGKPVGFSQLPGGESQEVAATLNLYFKSINQADYDTAYAQKHPSAQTPKGLAAFTKGVNTSKDSNIKYQSLARSGRDLVVWTTFRSEQSAEFGPAGLACADWSLDYTLRQSDGLWLIVSSAAHGGGERFTACVGD